MNEIKFALLCGLISNTVNQEEKESRQVVHSTKVINTTFLEALNYPELVMAMFEQLEPGFMKGERQLYITEIVFEGMLVMVIGTYDQWRAFFSGKWELLAGWEGNLMSHN